MITVYTLESCPKCKILKTKLERNNIEFKECQDREEMEMLDIEEVPMLDTGDIILTYGEAINWINNQ